MSNLDAHIEMDFQKTEKIMKIKAEFIDGWVTGRVTQRKIATTTTIDWETATASKYLNNERPLRGGSKTHINSRAPISSTS